MLAIMYDGLEFGKFIDGQLVLNNGVKKSWLPYIFELAIDNNIPVEKAIDAWKKERVFPKNRVGKGKILKELGLSKYNVDDIAMVTRCSLVLDPYWIVYEEGDRYTTHSVRGRTGDSRLYPYNSIGIEDEEAYIWRI